MTLSESTWVERVKSAGERMPPAPDRSVFVSEKPYANTVFPEAASMYFLFSSYKLWFLTS